MSRLKALYANEVKQKLKEELNSPNIMAVPRLTKITLNMGVGEALVSVLLEDGVPSIVERTLVRPPSSRMGPATQQERQAVIDNSAMHRRYAVAYDPRSAHEVLMERTATRLQAVEDEEARVAQEKVEAKNNRSSRSSGGNRQSVTEALLKSVVRSIGSSLGRGLGKNLLRGILGSLIK